MEQRLKKQRRRLIMRITLILSVVWLAVSATYCVVRLRREKSDLQSDALSALSRAKQSLSKNEIIKSMSNKVYLNSYNLIYFKNLAEEDTDAQLIVVDPDSNATIADTAYKTDVKYSLETDDGTFPDDYGYLDYRTIRGLLSDAQYERIAEWLRQKPDGEGSYELVCNRFYFSLDEIIPLELSVMRVRNADDNFDSEDIAETFLLSGSDAKGDTVYRNARSKLNLIPKGFFLKTACNGDFISTLTREERESNAAVFSRGNLEYLFYSSDYYYLDAVVYNKQTDSYESEPKIYLLQYAKKASLPQNCGSDLLWGVAAVFVFFFAIGLILCVMIWRTVRMQIVQEQKRLDFTNALAHDIKTPLFVISGYAYSLKENIDSGERDSYLDKIITQTEQINGLVHKMLNLSKLDSYSMTLNRSEFELAGLVGEILEDYKSLPERRTISYSHSGKTEISADKELIRTALQNLIENAVKYSLADSEIAVEVLDKTVSISNSSAPISKADMKKIWQPYFRMDKSRHKKGNGLGLSIVKSILDLHSVKYGMNYRDGRVVFRAEF
ncbi:MAG: HAMP domain-containing histidine kinase [Clostridia bacterium]|nr:HAMP domain-containing histidine kinase [Clostridia bacterium]